MTYSPTDLITAQKYICSKTGLTPIEVGIKGDDNHATSGGYHIGNDGLNAIGRLSTDYSKRESSRDRPGSNAASAIDVGYFDVIINGVRINLRQFSIKFVEKCKAGDPRTADIREVIYSPDGQNVYRWDRLGIRASGDDSHLSHTHTSFFRDSEGRRSGLDNYLGLVKEILEGEDDMFTDKDRGWLAHLVDVMAAFEKGDPVMWTKDTVAAVAQLSGLVDQVNQLNTKVDAINTRLASLQSSGGLTDADRKLIADLKTAIAGLAPGV